MNQIAVSPEKLGGLTEETHTNKELRTFLETFHALAEGAYWVKGTVLAELDRQGKWMDGYEGFFEWYCDFIEARGFTRPEPSESSSFYRQVRNGYFVFRCAKIGVVDQRLFVRLGRTKADEVHRHHKADLDAKKIKKKEMTSIIEHCTKLNRTDTIRLLGENSKVRAGKLDPGAEPHANAPIDEGCRPPSTRTINCPECAHKFEVEL